MEHSTSRPLVYRINVAQAKLGVSRATIYRRANEGHLCLVKVGKRASGVTAASVHAMIGATPPPERSEKKPEPNRTQDTSICPGVDHLHYPAVARQQKRKGTDQDVGAI